MQQESNWIGFFFFWGIVLLLIFNPVALGTIMFFLGLLVGAVVS